MKSLLLKMSELVRRNNPDLPAFDPEIESWRSYYKYMWATVCLNPDEMLKINQFYELAIKNKDRYRFVEKSIGVPWQLIAGIHGRESAFRFDCCLHNGDPLGKKTVNVPAGRGPFLTWEDSAIDALTLRGFNHFKTWGIEEMLCIAEVFNGLGYLKYHDEIDPGLDVHSPYLWSCTNHYTQGKYASDGKFDPSLKDKQVGIAALLLKFEEKGLL